MTFGSSFSQAYTMAPNSRAGHIQQHGCGNCVFLRPQHGHMWWSRTQAFLWPVVATWAMDINTDPNWEGTMDTGTDLCSSLSQDVTMVLGGSIDHSDWHHSGCRMPNLLRDLVLLLAKSGNPCVFFKARTVSDK
ncbi:hypothetical protein STEG23_002988, partial [Scotinomys teguina]